MLLHSEKLELGIRASDFALRSVDGKEYTLASVAEAKVLVLMFICSHCPYVQAIEDRLIRLGRDYQDRGVQCVAICSNDPTHYPEDAPEALLRRWEEKQYGFPYLLDSTQDVARAYGALCTPDLYVYDQQRRLAYHGRLDDSWQDAEKVQKQDLREAIDRLLAGERPSEVQHSSMGCSIKWKK